MQIVLYPHPRFSSFKSGSDHFQISTDLHNVVREMFELMYTSEGIGLAANQVGLPYRRYSSST